MVVPMSMAVPMMKCDDMNNMQFQRCVASDTVPGRHVQPKVSETVVCELGQPPIQRLSRSWN